MNLRRVVSLRDFDALGSIWEQVATEGGQTTSPFTSHDWFACCWRTAGAQTRREAWLLEDAAGPLAVIPLVSWRGKLRGLPVRSLALMDSPEASFVDFPVARDLDDVVARLFALLRQQGDWDVLWLSRLRADAASTKALQSQLTEAGLAWRIASRDCTPYLSITGTLDTFCDGRSERVRHAMSSVDSDHGPSGTLSIEEHRDVDPDGPIFAQIMDVASESWCGPRGVSMASMNAMQRFFRELTRRMSARGWLRVWLVRVDGRAVVSEYQLSAGGRVHALQTDVAADVPEASPRAYLTAAIVRSLFERREIREYEMGPGMNEHKHRWATGAHELVSLEVFAPTAYGRLLHYLHTHVVPMAQRWVAPMSRSAAV